MGLIAFVLVCWAIGKWLIEVSGEATTRVISAAKGNPPPAVKEKRGGFWRYMGESWRGWWEREEAALAAARAANPPTATAKVRWRDRWAAASKRFQERPEVADRTPVGEAPTPDPADTPTPPPATTPGPDAWNAPTPTGGATAAGWEAVECQVCHAAVLTSVGNGTLRCPNPGCPSNTAPAGDPPQPDSQPRHAAPEPDQGGSTMTAPTGEVVNYETHVAELKAEIAEQRRTLDLLDAAVKSCAETKARVDEAQQHLQASAGAAQTKQEHLQGLHLDGTTVAHAATATEALSPNRVNDLYEHVEAMEAELQKRRGDAADALASMEAELQHVQAKHGDHHAHVASELSGDARYLDSGTGTTTRPTPTPVGAAA